MYSFGELLKKIRQETSLTQAGLAGVLGVSTILVAKIEDGERLPSRNFIELLAKKLKVSPAVIVPFVYDLKYYDANSKVEKRLVHLGEDLQRILIKHKSRNLLK